MADDNRPLASLSSSLLARRGAARPAMRPQAIQMAHGITSPLEDLGWNDMGDEPHDLAHPVPQAAPAEPATVLRHTPDVEPVPVVSPVMQQHEELARSFAPSDHAPLRDDLARPARAKVKAAFTLRLDAERHLKLRLLCAVQHRSAQQLVTQALDEFLSRNSEQLVLPATFGGNNNPSTGDR